MKSTPATSAPPEQRSSSADAPLKGQDHDDSALDEALRESFPSSDPVAITIDPPANWQHKFSAPQRGG